MADSRIDFKVTAVGDPRDFALALKSAFRKMGSGAYTPPKGRPTPKRTTPAKDATGKHLVEELLGKPPKSVSASYRNKRRAKNRAAGASRRINRHKR
jgi:hypothetical protein